MEKEKLYHGIDACRAGSDDLYSEELAELAELVERDDEVRRMYERSQRFDTAVRDAFGDVDVPPGLADRLLAGVAQRLVDSERLADSERLTDTESPANSASDAMDDAARIQPPTQQPVQQQDSQAAPTPATRQFDRRRALRWCLAGSGVALVAAVVAVAALVANWSVPSVSVDQLVHDVDRWMDGIDHQAWQDPAAAPAPGDYPLESSIHVNAARWQRFETPLDSRAVVYDLARPGQGVALAFTVRTRRAYDVPANLPAMPLSTTGGFSIGACLRKGVLYVLVVEGEAQHYRQFVETRMPVT